MNSFVNFRRAYLDRLLSTVSFTGDVLDIGGERKTTRGKFRPPATTRSWKYLNIDAKTQPDLCASADAIPLPDRSVDMVLLTEVLEHLEYPVAALRECRRILKSEGSIIITTPFLFPVHGDPHDFRRWTKDGLRSEVEGAGFEVLEVKPMGGMIAVYCDIFEAYCQSFYVDQRRPGFFSRLARRLIRGGASAYLFRMDARMGYENYATTGYFLRAKVK
jgi:SAM-dependent methyltransferase